MTSFGCKEIDLSGFEPNFRIQGQVCHLIGSLAPNDDQNAAFLQIYFLDERDRIGSRMAITDNIRPEIVLDYQQTLHVNNIYIKELKSAYKYVHEHQLKGFNISIVALDASFQNHYRYRGENCCWAIKKLDPFNSPNTFSAIRFYPTAHFPTTTIPLRPCLGSTINKAQGQTLQVVGLDLRTPVFSRGMLYVALSRTGTKDVTHILTEGEVTLNVVYPEALDFGEGL